jgi:hypothetical protein
MAGDLKARHMDWISRLITAKSALLLDYAERNANLICGLDSPTTGPYQKNTKPYVLCIVFVKEFV